VSKKTRGLLIGALSGALLGAVLAWAVLSREETVQKETRGQGRRRLQAQPGGWLRLAVTILQAGRQLAELVSVS